MAVDRMNLWPSAEWLIQIERKYSQSLSSEDLTGEDASKSKPIKKKMEETIEAAKGMKFLEQTELKYVTSDEFFLPKIMHENHEKGI